MLEICKILMDRGYKITLVAPGNFTATSTLYRSIPQIITRIDGVYQDFDGIFFNEYTFKSWANIMKILTRGYDKHFNNYLQAYKETKPDLLFCNFIENEACFDLALKLKKPVVGYASHTTFFTPPSPIRSDPIMGCHVNMEKESFYNRFICAIVQPLRLHWMFRDYLNHINARRAEVGISKSHEFREKANTLFLTNSFFGFEVPTAWLPIHQEIGPILPDTFPNLSPDLELFLSTHLKTMYIALGTLVYTTPKNFAILLQSALELINRNILDGVIWSIVNFNESELPSTINLSTGKVIPTSNLLNNLHPHVYIMKHSPQFAILSHENTKVFLSHGGLSSSHESIYTATPINENGELEVNPESLLRCWITPDSRMGFFRGNYLDVFGAAMIIVLALISSLSYGFYKAIMLAYRKWGFRSRNSQS
ncbi:UDP-Glycosyltransferase/glycogen phosphorylase [Gigaspora margarita]|nr:UDP-Glycosyltransferase/glycogen phosphorylase [Gigaspora margarita]